MRLTNNRFYNFTPQWQPLPAAGSPAPLPNAPTFSISGKVTTREGIPFGVTLRICGRINATIQMEEPTSNAADQFNFVRLPQGGNYTITPESPRFTFTPPSRTYDNLSANVTGADFVAALKYVTIGGRITDEAAD